MDRHLFPGILGRVEDIRICVTDTKFVTSYSIQCNGFHVRAVDVYAVKFLMASWPLIRDP